MESKVYTEGLLVKEAVTKFGSILKLSVKVDEFVKFLEANQKNGWVNIDLLEKKDKVEGKPTHYGVLNTFTKKETVSAEVVDGDDDKDTLPF